MCTGQGMSINVTIGITRLSENLVRDGGIEERYWEPQNLSVKFFYFPGESIIVTSMLPRCVLRVPDLSYQKSSFFLAVKLFLPGNPSG